MHIRRMATKLAGHPAFFLVLIALLTSLIVQSGNLGSVDTGRRLQVAHSFWTGEPPVIQETGDDFGAVGRNGQLQAWFGIGQSLLMLIPDMIATKLVNSVSSLREIDRRENGSIRRTLVAYQISPLVCVLGVLVSFYLIQLLGFHVHEAIAGALTLLFATTFLHYTQIAQENNFILLMTLLGFYCQYRWFQLANPYWLIAGAAAFGFNLLTRMTTGFDLLAGALFIVVCLWRSGLSAQVFKRQLLSYTLTCMAVYSFFVLGDRLYHYYRFGTFLGTYIQLYGEKWKLLHPELPASFPFSTPFLVGFLGPLVTPDKSIFIFDPLLIVTLILVIKFRRLIASNVSALVLSLGVLSLGYISFYATYFDWSGNAAWGDRFVTTPVQLLAMMSVPLLLRFRHHLKSFYERGVYYAIAALSVVIQCASVVLSYNLELLQAHVRGGSRFIVGLRFANLLAMATGSFEKWGLAAGIPERLTSINLMPFGPAQNLPGSAGTFLTIIWAALVCMLIVTVFIFAKKVLRGDFQPRYD
jgi:hypothetical protein